jgi:predicted phosphoadenosine phosphosulfate sulfurtransferase
VVHVAKTLKTKVVNENVYELALERVREAYRRFDNISVAFSGGKDSTCVLQVTIEIARELGRLPVDAFFWDEEAIYPKTVEYVERVRTRGDVRLRWLCVPHEHRNACSRKEPYWYPWDPKKTELWVRQPPSCAERSLPGLINPVPIPEGNPFIFHPSAGTVGILTGIRAQESLRRLRIVTMKEVDNWISVDSHAQWVMQCKPIYDWKTEDVWTAPKKFGWDYNEQYDLFEQLGISRHVQRVCPPFGEEPLQNLYAYAVLAPETWERMIGRVHGARTAAKFARSPLYGMGGVDFEDGPAAIQEALAKWNPEERSAIAKRIADEIDSWNQNTGNVPIPKKAGPGQFSWEFLVRIARRGDLKKRKSADRFIKEPK